MLSWAKSIVCYTIAVSLLMGILPEGNYKKYVKFFTGIVLSLLIVSPVMKLCSFDTLLVDNYSKSVSKLWDEEQVRLEEQEQKNLEIVMEQMLDSMGYSLEKVQYEKTQEGNIIGMIVCVKTNQNIFEVPVMLVGKIEEIERIVVNVNDKTSLDTTQEKIDKEENKSDDLETISALKAIIGAVSGVEEENIEIVLK